MTARTSDPAGGDLGAPARDPRTTTLVWVGGALLLAGAAVLAHVAWQLYGTTWVADRDRGRAVDAVERVWDGPTASPDDRALADDVVALVRIPAFGDD
jgi:hypothetical protein